MPSRLLTAAPILAGLICAASASGAANLVGSAAQLQAMDKVTARISKLEGAVGKAIRYGDLEIVVRSCRKRPPEEEPESAAFLEIYELKKGKARRRVFSGWMFASSPALSAMEHPVYDVWVVDCKVPGANPNKGVKKAATGR